MNAGNDKGKRGATWFLMAVGVFALLIWARQRLVNGVPRTAYADPPVEEPKPAVDKTPPVKPGAPKQ